MSTDPNFVAGDNSCPPGRRGGILGEPGYPELPPWLREMYPFRTRSLELAQERISLVDEGPASAPAVVLLHGSPGWSFEYRKLIPLLARTRRVIVPDMVGFGLSSKPAGSLSLEQQAKAIAELIEALGLRDLTLVLHGWGGPVGMAYAVRHPDNIARLVLTNTWAMPLPHALNVKLPFGVRLALGGGLGCRLDEWLKLSVTSGLESATPGLVVESYKYPYQHGESSSEVRMLWRMLRRPDENTVRFLAWVEAALGKVTAPADIVWGRQDSLLGSVAAYLLRDRLKGAGEIAFVEHAGHYVAEDAAEELAVRVTG